jgi:capsule polysaccharide modification protein KpsS
MKTSNHLDILRVIIRKQIGFIVRFGRIEKVATSSFLSFDNPERLKISRILILKLHLT